jgi:hypothetical protein
MRATASLVMVFVSGVDSLDVCDGVECSLFDMVNVVSCSREGDVCASTVWIKCSLVVVLLDGELM